MVSRHFFWERKGFADDDPEGDAEGEGPAEAAGEDGDGDGEGGLEPVAEAGEPVVGLVEVRAPEAEYRDEVGSLLHGEADEALAVREDDVVHALLRGHGLLFAAGADEQARLGEGLLGDGATRVDVPHAQKRFPDHRQFKHHARAEARALHPGELVVEVARPKAQHVQRPAMNPVRMHREQEAPCVFIIIIIKGLLVLDGEGRRIVAKVARPELGRGFL
mmetsp:Transcript_32104/g.102389  ORF Transcript_32104/g.102389 Transcript_32104/m.102389 type:complete len:219 (-) Transcript_32104:597-1253(-)